MSSKKNNKHSKSLIIQTEDLEPFYKKKLSVDSQNLDKIQFRKSFNDSSDSDSDDDDTSNDLTNKEVSKNDLSTTVKRESFGNDNELADTIKKEQEFAQEEEQHIEGCENIEINEKQFESAEEKVQSPKFHFQAKDTIDKVETENLDIISPPKKRHLDRIKEARERAKAIRQGTKQKNSKQNYGKSQQLKGNCFTLNEAELLSMSSTNDLPSRLYALDMKNKVKIEELRTEIIEEEMNEVKAKPKIDKNSKRICEKNCHIPIHMRYSWVKDDKERKIQQMKDEKQKKETEELSQMNSTTQIKEARNPEEYYDYMMRWQQYRDQMVLESRKAKLEQSAEAFSFKPKINKSSANIKREQGIVERLLTTGEMKKERLEYLNTLNTHEFTPKLNEKSKKLASNRGHHKVNELNYNESMDFLVKRLKKFA